MVVDGAVVVSNVCRVKAGISNNLMWKETQIQACELAAHAQHTRGFPKIGGVVLWLAFSTAHRSPSIDHVQIGTDRYWMALNYYFFNDTDTHLHNLRI